MADGQDTTIALDFAPIGARLIPLTQGKYAIVDAEDFEWLNQYKWCAAAGGNLFYAIRNKQRTIRMHRFILDAPHGMHVDHINHNGLDNRRCNLRICTAQQNNWNSRAVGGKSNYKGVWRNKAGWAATVLKDRKKNHCGTFKTEIEAARAYDVKARELFGEYACLNFCEDET